MHTKIQTVWKLFFISPGKTPFQYRIPLFMYTRQKTDGSFPPSVRQMDDPALAEKAPHPIENRFTTGRRFFEMFAAGQRFQVFFLFCSHFRRNIDVDHR